MTPEEKAREEIDAMLAASGWVVQTKDRINLGVSRGVAVSELSFATGEPDYTLFVDGKALGTVEAKPAGHSLTGVEEQILEIRRRSTTSNPESSRYERHRMHRAGSRISTWNSFGTIRFLSLQQPSKQDSWRKWSGGCDTFDVTQMCRVCWGPWRWPIIRSSPASAN